MSEPTDDEALERQVVAHYEALGYTVTPDVEIDSHQIDLLASRTLDSGTVINMMIEVKHRSTAPVGVNEVTKFITTAQGLMADMIINNAVMVTDNTYTARARAKVLGKSAIRLLTVKQLEEDIFSYSDSLLRLIREYDTSVDHREYIPLAGEDTATGAAIDDVVIHALAWARENGDLLAVIGDFGSGKTTLLKRIRYEQARRRVAGTNERYPILLNLRAFRENSSLWSFIVTELRDGQFIFPSRATFEAQLKSGRLLILLDGFDEIETGATVHDRRRYLESLAPLLKSPCPCIMTTRATYFESIKELEESIQYGSSQPIKLKNIGGDKLDFEDILNSFGISPPPHLAGLPLRNVIGISQLGDDGIRRYLKNIEADLVSRTGKTANDIYEFLKQLYDLGDLIGRPLLIKMVISTIFKGQLSLEREHTRLGPAGLYEIYTQASAVRDQNIRTRPLDGSERLLVCQLLAYKMLRKGSIELTAAEVAEALTPGNTPLLGLNDYVSQQFVGRDSLGRIERILSDIRVCTFLSFTEDGGFHFTHKSFYEFFLAQAVFQTIVGARSGLSRLAELPISAEVMYFLASYAADEPKFGEKVVDLYNESQTTDISVRSFFARIIFCAPHLLSNRRINGVQISNCRLRGQRIESAELQDVVFENVSIFDLMANQWKIIAGTASYLRIDGSTFRRSEIVIRGNNTRLVGVRFEAGKLSLHGTSTVSENCVMYKVLMELHGGTNVLDSEIMGSEISVGPASMFNNVDPEETRQRFTLPNIIGRREDIRQGHRADSGAILERCTLGDGTLLELLPRARAHLKDCKLLGLCINFEDFERIVETDSGSNANIVLENCSGLLLVVSPDESRLSWLDTEIFRRRFSKLVVGVVNERHSKPVGEDTPARDNRTYRMDVATLDVLTVEVAARDFSPGDRQIVMDTIEAMAAG